MLILMLVILTIWIAGKLVKNENSQVIIKLLAWTVNVSYTLSTVLYQLIVISLLSRNLDWPMNMTSSWDTMNLTRVSLSAVQWPPHRN